MEELLKELQIVLAKYNAGIIDGTGRKNSLVVSIATDDGDEEVEFKEDIDAFTIEHKWYKEI